MCPYIVGDPGTYVKITIMISSNREMGIFGNGS
jgi:hypothetical protein